MYPPVLVRLQHVWVMYTRRCNKRYVRRVRDNCNDDDDDDTRRVIYTSRRVVRTADCGLRAARSPSTACGRLGGRIRLAVRNFRSQPYDYDVCGRIDDPMMAHQPRT